MPEVTALYAGILGLIAMALSFMAGSRRGKTGISIGDGGDPEMLLAVRRHANFIEYVPLILILVGLLEMKGVSSTAVHVMLGGLVFFRIAHAQGLRADSMQGLGRLIGAMGTAIVLVVSSIWNIVIFF